MLEIFCKTFLLHFVVGSKFNTRSVASAEDLKKKKMLIEKISRIMDKKFNNFFQFSDLLKLARQKFHYVPILKGQTIF
jgi:hypothetical protein